MRRQVFSFVFFIVVCASLAKAKTPVVRTHSGAVSGVATSDGGVVSFKGIRFAAPPTGKLRWSPPGSVAPWKETLKADHFGASCIQGPNNEFLPWTKEFMYVTPVSEDCLFLNVWTPKVSAAARLPVLVYIHGGAFTSGSGDVPVYDGEALARTGMVIVTINYRLGALGFFAHPSLTAESQHHSSGNYGLLDQIAALRWVKENISGFGGDAARVTIAGQSAGAMSVADLLAAPLAKGLFSGAIADSGIGGRGVPMQSLAEAEKAGEAFASAKKATSIAQLRALPASEFAKPAGRFSPIVDGWVVPENAVTATEKKDGGNDVPVITGFQANDAALGGPRSNSAEEFRNRATKVYGPMADEFLKLYPAGSDEEAHKSGVDSGRDRLKAGMYLWASKHAETHKSPVYIYYFDRAVPWPAHPEFGAFHSGELPYTFGNLAIFDRPWEPVDRKIAKMMMTYWKDFATSGGPNDALVPTWDPVDPSKPILMRLGADSGPIPVADPSKLDFWRRYFESPQSKDAGPF
ncbi:MAG: carboxylesterase family protein [Acidobacteria bacterium]|nr:carboxylesterase family protein [Acidobacteriota bacterium]